MQMTGEQTNIEPPYNLNIDWKHLSGTKERGLAKWKVGAPASYDRDSSIPSLHNIVTASPALSSRLSFTYQNTHIARRLLCVLWLYSGQVVQSIEPAAGLEASFGPSLNRHHAVPRIKRTRAPFAFSPLRPPLPTTPAPPRSPQPDFIGLVSFFVFVLFVLGPVTLCLFLPISLDVSDWKDFRPFFRPVPPGPFPCSFL
jgi:hypothetical protein